MTQPNNDEFKASRTGRGLGMSLMKTMVLYETFFNYFCQESHPPPPPPSLRHLDKSVAEQKWDEPENEATSEPYSTSS